MRSIRSNNTTPELMARRLIHSMGYRYRLHARDLPGKPDIVFAKYKAVIFVHGCFWHLHSKCREGRIPSSNVSYWSPKLQRNVARDIENQKTLRKTGWRILVLWECELRIQNCDRLEKRISRFLEHRRVPYS
jgi:DNA mismatch endonuclease (patch repair protein)